MRPRGLAAYAALGLPLAMAMLPIYMISPKFYGDGLGVDLAALGAVLFLTRMLDTIQDPFLGRVVDAYQRKRYGWRVLMLVSGLLLALGFVMLFTPPEWSAGGLLGWLTLSLVIVYFAHSLLSICYLTWGARLTDDIAERSRVTAWREAFGLIGVVVASVLPTFWVADWGPRQGYQLFAWVFVAVLVVGLLTTLFAAPSPKVSTVGSLEGWRAALSPLAVRKVMWFYLFNAISVAIPATLVLFFIDDVVQAPQQAGLFLGVYFLAGMLTLPLWVALSDRIGKAFAWLLGSVLAAASLLSASLIGPGDVMGFALICFASGAALGADVALPPAMLADAIPEEKRRSTGLYFGIWVLISKFALALAAGLALPSLKIFGYMPGQVQTVSGLIALYVFLPIIFKVGAIAVLFPQLNENWLTRTFVRKGSQK
ncbi:MFS transporter [Zwartia sp.]|uniref:MFS transporter n=1 Tax=Zwartia sp. TaxID=2978004 RepID=UPI0027291791|nr:MFS transporter [Zwartia sp.]MDO9024140.1 MFS transporter [Zwartia sp.]